MGQRKDVADGVVDVVLGDEHEVGGVAERDEAVRRGDAPIGPVKPASTSAVTTPSQTPPRAAGLVDDQHPAAARACGTMSSTGSGASQRRSSTRHADALAGQALGDPQDQVQAVAEGHDEQVVAVAVRARAAPIGTWLVQLGGVRRSQPSSPGSCRSRVW